MKLRVLLIGSGARENTLAKVITQSPSLNTLYAYPGNPGIFSISKQTGISKNDNSIIVQWAIDNSIDLIVCGPEQPLVGGLADMALEKGIPVFGPKVKGAMLEGSKIYSKEFMARYNIPTADFKIFDNPDDAFKYINQIEDFPIVVKADGLAAGKGVKIPKNREEAVDAIEQFMVKKIHGTSGDRVLIEHFMSGEELSAFYITDSKTFVPMITAKDYKRAFDNNQGDNTGGMGCYAPHSSLTPDLTKKIENEIISKIKEGFLKDGIDYRGVLYVGLMLTEEGPKVVEFNCRFGDPEAQVILPLCNDDLLAIFYDTAQSKLGNIKLKWADQYAASVVLASGGYPGNYQKGYKINFKDKNPYEYIHAGTVTDQNGDILTNGGRVLNAVGFGMTKKEALENAYKKIKKVNFTNSFYRNDIGS